MKNKIGIFDSGLGGLSILKNLIKELPNENYIFYEDSINNPYGDKSYAELMRIVCKIIDFLINENCKLIIIACNTATTMCINDLRNKYPDIIFVGTVPAIKVAFDSHYKNVIILSTPNTSKSKEVLKLINNYKNNDEIINNLSGENLANLIELDKKEDINILLHKLLDEYKDNCDALVLGCTHYSLIKNEFKSVLPNTILLDGVIGITNEVRHQLEINNLLSEGVEKGSIKIINSKSDELIKKSLDFLRRS